MANIQSNLERLRSIEGYIGSCLVDSESGMTLGLDGGGALLNLELAAAGNTEVVRAKRKAMKFLNLRDEIERRSSSRSASSVSPAPPAPRPPRRVLLHGPRALPREPGAGPLQPRRRREAPRDVAQIAARAARIVSVSAEKSVGYATQNKGVMRTYSAEGFRRFNDL